MILPVLLAMICHSNMSHKQIRQNKVRRPPTSHRDAITLLPSEIDVLIMRREVPLSADRLLSRGFEKKKMLAYRHAGE
jgi:hypothetical protein